ncbi:hypothetical protein [Acaryochloris sp. IP29b_bin.137]|uniref:hypothetical protein n=1 Tax=Acaryochloris sp. IP29b_bin.137 TaxID=2969217 RepID=UPI00261044AB|nr:hypothetical protein [Acaryochloris sp. IP29b_bin.137]
MTDTQDSSEFFAVTEETIRALVQKIGFALSQEDLQAIFNKKIFAPNLPTGCITALTYCANGDLETVRIDDITFTSKSIQNDKNSGLNLNDFKERFQEAANFGHSVRLTINESTESSKNKIVSLSVFPHRCLNKGRNNILLSQQTNCIEGINCPGDPYE